MTKKKKKEAAPGVAFTAEADGQVVRVQVTEGDEMQAFTMEPAEAMTFGRAFMLACQGAERARLKAEGKAAGINSGK